MDSHTILVTDKKRPTRNIERGTIHSSSMETTLNKNESISNIITTVDERPMKIQRLQQDDINSFVEEHKSSTLNIYEYDVSCQNENNVTYKHLDRLQMLIQRFNQSVTPCSYNVDDTATDMASSTTNIDTFAHECTEIIKLFDWTHLYHIDCMMTFHQLHGILFLWLSNIITSHIPWDVTNIDCFLVHKKLLTTTNHICSCLLEIYRITPNLCNVALPSIDSFLILFKALLFLTKPIDRSKPIGYTSMALLTTLFEVIDCTLHHVNCVRGLSSYEFHQFLLCLVQASTTGLDSTSAPVERVDTPSTNQVARHILEGLNHSLHESDSTFAKFVQVATCVISDSNILPPIERNDAIEKLSSLKLFHIRCVLQLPYKQTVVPNIVDSLHRFYNDILTCSDSPLCDKLLVLDCVVIITSSRYTFESEHVERTMYGIISDILVHVLSVPDINSGTHILKAKAIEGMQNLSELNLSTYIMDESRYENMTVQCMVTSLFNICIQQLDGTYEDINSNTGVDDETDPLWNYPMEDSVLGAAEVLLAILSHILIEYGSSSFRLPVQYVMNMFSNLLNYFSSSTNPKNILSMQYPKRNQHIQYMIIHMISNNIETLGLYIQTYPSLVTAMADVLKIDDFNYSDDIDPQVVMAMQRTILNAYRYLLETNQSIYQSILGRDCNITGAVSSVVVMNDISLTTGESMQEIAIELLCTLSDDVFNRSMMARQANLLSGMIRYLRRMDIDDTVPTRNTIQRDRLKQCVAQLSAVL